MGKHKVTYKTTQPIPVQDADGNPVGVIPTGTLIALEIPLTEEEGGGDE